MLSRDAIIQERSLNVRKRQVYSKIGILSANKRLRSVFGFLPYFAPPKRSSSQKFSIFSVKGGSTAYIVRNDDLAEKAHCKLKWIDLAITILTIVNLMIWTIENSMFYSNGSAFTAEINKLRFTIQIITLPTIVLVYQSYKWTMEYNKHKGELRVNAKILEWDYLSKVLLEILYNAIHPIPGIDKVLHIQQREYETDYCIDDFLYLISMGKLYWVIRMFRHFSMFGDMKAFKICQHYRKPGDTSFTIRAHINKNPFIFESLLMVIAIVLFCVPVQVFERVLNLGLQELYNDMWLMALVFSTIGYGETTPVTNLGRVTTAIAAYIGVFLFSLLIVSMTNLSILTKGEFEAYNYLERSRRLQDHKIQAANFIKKFLTYLKMRKRRSKLGLQQAFLDMLLYKKKFESTKLLLKISEEGSYTILENIKDQASVDFGIIKSRISKLNLDKYKQLCQVNEQANETFSKAQKSLHFTENIVTSLEKLVVDNYCENSSLNEPSQGSENAIKQHLEQMKKECFQSKLISASEMKGSDDSIMQKFKMETEHMLSRKRRNGHNVTATAKAIGIKPNSLKNIEKNPKVLASLLEIGSQHQKGEIIKSVGLSSSKV